MTFTDYKLSLKIGIDSNPMILCNVLDENLKKSSLPDFNHFSARIAFNIDFKYIALTDIFMHCMVTLIVT